MKTIKKEGEEVVTTPVAGEVVPEAVINTEVDLEAEYNRLVEENAKLSKERDNYKKGMLLAKGKIVEDTYDTPSQPPLDETIEKIVAEKLLATQEAQNLMKQNEVVKKALQENRELKLALANRKQVDNSGVGSGGGDEQPVKDRFLSPAQIKDLKNRGWSDEKIELYKKNLAKAI